MLSHPEQAARLRRACPEAADTAVLAGDPCFDRALAARPYRERFRRALGVRRGQRLVVLNSTWNPESLFGDGGGEDLLPSLLPRLTSGLPADAYRLVAVLHPNLWHGHGPGQIRAWLDRARRCGLTLIDPLRHWRQALVAADAVIGDHGAVTYYAAALGTPVLLGAAPVAGLDPESPAAAFVRSAPRLDPALAPLPQVEALLAAPHADTGPDPDPGPTEFTTSVPGEAAVRLRRLFYGMMRLPEPPSPALLEPLPLPPYEPPPRAAPFRVVTRVRDGAVTVERYADPSREPGTPGTGSDGSAHTAVHEDTKDPRVLALADVIFREGAADDPRLGGPARWTAEVLDRYPQCALAAHVTGPGTCVVRVGAGGPLLRLVTDGPEADLDPSAAASALHAWISADGDPVGGAKLLVRAGAAAHPVSVTPVEE